MHTTDLWRDPYYHVHADTSRYVAHHNGDFSGDVIIHAITCDDRAPGGEKTVSEMVVPFEALLTLFGRFVLQEKEQELERTIAVVGDPSRGHLALRRLARTGDIR